jgi:ribose/xylose/arabinose/galactoside ABC-type transport system permease subunit
MTAHLSDITYKALCVTDSRGFLCFQWFLLLTTHFYHFIPSPLAAPFIRATLIHPMVAATRQGEQMYSIGDDPMTDNI